MRISTPTRPRANRGDRMPWYVYGVTRRTEETAPPPGLRGVDDAPVEVVGSGDLQVVAGEVPGSFRDLATAPDDDVVEAVRRHDDVLHDVAQHRPVLPVRFGTVLPDEAAIEDLLADTDRRLQQSLDHVADADEWVVAVSVGVLEDTSADLDEDLPPGHAFFARRRSAAALRQQHRTNAIALATDLDARFQGVARDFRPLDLRDVDMVARGAYLVPRTVAATFVEAARSDGVARVDVQGPLPPYRFAEPGS